jgi:hypothetical protein
MQPLVSSDIANTYPQQPNNMYLGSKAAVFWDIFHSGNNEGCCLWGCDAM